MKLSGCALIVALAAAALDAAPRIQRIQLSITNPVPIARTENVVLTVAQLKRVDPRFNAANAIVVATNAANLADDARVMQAAELPSQADDLDGDGKLDELVFQIDLAASQTRIVTIAYGDQAGPGRMPPGMGSTPAWKATLRSGRFAHWNGNCWFVGYDRHKEMPSSRLPLPRGGGQRLLQPVLQRCGEQDGDLL